MTGEIQVRKATITDAEHIIKFNIAMAKETEDKALPLEKITAGVMRLLEKPEHGFYLLAEKEGQIAGSLMITYEWSDWRDGLFWWIQSVYVKPEFRRTGIYRSLYTHVKMLAEKDGTVCGFRLYVEKENFIAQKTYRSLGMQKTNYIIYEQLV
ncbi:GNAT family N-acetyltransferase [candidate division KSB1 bacterium]|nr:GNAT family N-acetyltransferase [candidate division KSB1 bacterium]